MLLKKSPIKTYEPKKRIELHKEALPFLTQIWINVENFSSFWALGFYSLLIFIAGVFKAKEKFEGFSRKREKILDLRNARRNLIH